VDYVPFQVAVIDLASKGVTLTVANVVAHLHVDPARVETMLDRMTRDGRVDLEVDEKQGSVVYRVRGLSTSTGRLLPEDMRIAGWRMPLGRHDARLKSVTWAIVLAGFFPGLGLAYAAPIRVVLLMSLLVFVLGNIFGAQGWLGPIYWFVMSVTSAFLGGVYAVRFNQEGRRATLHP
jgi:hypothetical protein